MSSILTNNGAMVALQTLRGINDSMAMTQNEISTGKSVATAKDNSAVWAISKVMESDVKGFEGISDSLSLGKSTVAVARNAAESITDLLTQIKGKVVAAQEENVDRAKIQTDIKALTDQVKSVVGSAQFNGLNLVNGTASSPVKILSSLNRDSNGDVKAAHIDVNAQNLSVDASGITNQTFGTSVGGNQTDVNAIIQGTGNTAFVVQDDATDTTLFTAQKTTGGAVGTLAMTSIAATNGTETITVKSVADKTSYEVVLGDLKINTTDGGTVTSFRSFQYVAGPDASQNSVAQNLVDQMNAFFGAATKNGDYSAAVANDNQIVISNKSGDAIKSGVRLNKDGTAASVPASAGLGALDSLKVTDSTSASQALGSIEGLIQKSIDSAAAFGSVEKRIEIQSDFVSKLTDSLKSGIGSMVDADMEEVSARLQALQVQQQLGTQSLSIANKAPQALLSLFR